MDLGSCPDAKWANIWSYCSLGEVSALQNPAKKKLCVKVNNWAEWGSWGEDLQLHTVPVDGEQWKRVLRGPQQACAPLLFAGLQTELSRQPPVFLLRSSSSCSDHLLWKPEPVKAEFSCFGSRQWCKLPVSQGALPEGLFDCLGFQLCLKGSLCISKRSVLLMVWAHRLNFTGEISSHSPRHLLLWWHKV